MSRFYEDFTTNDSATPQMLDTTWDHSFIFSYTNVRQCIQIILCVHIKLIHTAYYEVSIRTDICKENNDLLSQELYLYQVKNIAEQLSTVPRVKLARYFAVMLTWIRYVSRIVWLSLSDAYNLNHSLPSKVSRLHFLDLPCR